MPRGLRYSAGIASALFLAMPARAGQLATGSSPDIPVLRLLAALVICVAAAVGLIVALRARGGSAPRFIGSFTRLARAGRPRIEVIETRRVSLHADICLIRHDGAQILLLCGPGGNTILDRKPVDGHSEADEDALG